MKLATVAWLSAIGIALSSAIGWALAGSDVSGDESVEDWSYRGASEASAQFRKSLAGIDLEARLGHPVLAADGTSESYVYAGIAAERGEGVGTRPPIDVALVVDHSGSMRGKRLANAVAAARGVLGRLSTNDVVTFIAYNGSASVLVPPTPLDSFARERIERALDEMQAEGSTCISCALDTAVDALRGHSSSVSRVVLLSDGEATAGVRSVSGFRRIGESARHAGVAITTIGVDVDYDEQVLSALAEESNGHHYFVADASGLPAVFDEEFRSLARTVADAATLEIELMPGVERVKVFDRAYDQDGRRIRIPLGALSAGERKSVLVRVNVEGRGSGRRQVASVTLSFRDLDGDIQRRIHGELSALFTDDRDRLSSLDPFVAERVGRSETAATLTQANQLFAAGDGVGAREKLQTTIRHMSERRRTAVLAAPKARAREVDRGFARQEAALASAARGFASVPAAANPAKSRAGKSQIRANQSAAFDVSR